MKTSVFTRGRVGLHGILQTAGLAVREMTRGSYCGLSLWLCQSITLNISWLVECYHCITSIRTTLLEQGVQNRDNTPSAHVETGK